MSTLIKLTGSNDTVEEFLVFGTQVTNTDVSEIRKVWGEIHSSHPDWDRMDCIEELIEFLPRLGLQAEYFSGTDNTIWLPNYKENKVC